MSPKTKKSSAFSAAKRTTKDRLAGLKPGDIITGDDLLGNDDLDIPDEVAWSWGKDIPFLSGVLCILLD
jgi:hypothetical protein